jgi:hypothetical protein
MNKIAAFAIFGPLRVGFQHLDRCALDFNIWTVARRISSVTRWISLISRWISTVTRWFFNQYALDFVR